MILSRKDILEVNDIEYVEVKVPEWGGSVLVRGMSAAEREQFEAWTGGTDENDFRAKLVAMSAVGEDHKLLFSYEDVKALSEKNSKALIRLAAAAQKLSALTAQDLKELAENLA